MPLPRLFAKYRAGSRSSDTAASRSVMSGNDAFEGKVVFKYFDIGNLGGRGGPVRFMLFLHDVKFEEVLVQEDEWPAMKEKLISSGENPTGGLPVVYIGEKSYFGHVPVIKYLARKLNAVSPDVEAAYKSDALLDEYTAWRNIWSDSYDSDEQKKAYEGKRETLYALIERLYTLRSNTSSPYFMGMEKPGYDDLCVFSIIYDDQEHLGEMNLDSYPTLKTLYAKVGEIPIIADWVKQAQARK